MEIGRFVYLLEESKNEALDLEEIAEIEEAYAQIPDESLRDVRENATISDMLDELEETFTPIEFALYEYVKDNYGENEAQDPSWAIGPLADHLTKVMENK